jgi:anti-sigma regulatory factor (Ser/Thr protein kinase)
MAHLRKTSMTVFRRECLPEFPPPGAQVLERGVDGEDLVAVFPAVPSSVPAARAWIRQALTRRGWDTVNAHAAELLVSELATNAVQHSATARFTVWLAPADDTIEIAIQDGDGAALPQGRHDGDPGGTDGQEAEEGRGLVLVGALSQAWGVVATVDGKWVWSRLSLTVSDPPDHAVEMAQGDD